MVWFNGILWHFYGILWDVPSDINLVGGLEHDLYFPIQLGMSLSQLTFIFFRGFETTNQI